MWAAGFGGSQTTDGNAALGSNTATSRVFGTAVGADYRFSPFTHRRLLRSPAAAPISASPTAAPAVPTCSRPARLCGTYRRRLFLRRAGLWLAGRHHRPHRHHRRHRSAAREFNANAFSGRVEGGYRFVTPWIGGIGSRPMWPGSSPPSNCRPMPRGDLRRQHLCTRLCVKSVTAPAANSACAPTSPLRCRRHPDLARPRRMGARFQHRPQHRCDVPDAAGRDLRRQRRGAGRTTPRWSRLLPKEMAERLLARRDLRRRILQATRSYAGKGVARYAW